MSQAEQAMETLTNQWYNALVTGLSLSSSPDSYQTGGAFQLYQGTLSIGNTSDWLWGFLDAIPPAAINNYFQPDQSNLFSQQYGSVINQLQPSTGQTFINCMGDYYMQWMNYLKANTPDISTATKMQGVFRSWALMNAPDKAGCVSALIQYYQDPFINALLQYGNADAAGQGFAYNQTITMLQNSLQSGHSKTVNMDSNTQSSDVTHTWAGGSTSVAYDLFSFGASANYDKLTTQVTTAGLTITVTFNAVVTFPASPLATPYPSDPILSQYDPWYNSSVLSKAYQTKDNTVWKPGTPNWNSTFGPSGDMQRKTSALVVVDGVDATITSEATFASSDQTQIEAQASTGFWPFFTASGEGGFNNKVTFDDNGKMTVTQSSPAGNPYVLGVIVTPMSAVLG